MTITKAFALGSFIWLVGFGCGRLNLHASLNKAENVEDKNTTPPIQENGLVKKMHGERIWQNYFPTLSIWSLEYHKTMITISVALLAGQLVLTDHPKIASTFWITAAIFPTALCLMASLQTILTSRNSLYIIVRDAARAADIPEPHQDPFRMEKIKWVERLHHKTWRRIFLSNAIAMSAFIFGVFLMLISIAVPFLKNI